MVVDDDNEDNQKQARGVYLRALGLLARREHTAQELRYKLQAKGELSVHIEQAIQLLLQENYLSELRYVDMFVRAAVSRGNGPIKIRYTLHERGIAPDKIDIYLNQSETWQETDWDILAEKVLYKKFGKKQPNTWALWQKQAGYLQQKGFELEAIRSLLGVYSYTD